LYFQGDPARVAGFEIFLKSFTDNGVVKGRAVGGLGWARVLLSGVEFLGFVETPGGAIDVDDDGMVDHAVDGGCGNDGIAEVVAELFEVDVRGYDG